MKPKSPKDAPKPEPEAESESDPDFSNYEQTGHSENDFESSDLLPKSNGDFSEFAPKLDGKNFVDSYKFMTGEPSQSLRNANYQLRPDPVNPQDTSGACPWNQSTIYPENI